MPINVAVGGADVFFLAVNKCEYSVWLQWLRMEIHSKFAGFFLIDNSNNKLLGNEEDYYF